MGIVTVVGIVTIFASTYLILYSEQLYRVLSGTLRIFEKKVPFREISIDSMKREKAHIILVGLGQYGSETAENLLKQGKRIIGVDYDPDVLKRWRAKGISVLYRDIADNEIHDHLPIEKVSWIVSTVRVKEMNFALLQNLKLSGFKGKIALTAVNQREVRLYEKKGANLVFRPFRDASEQAGNTLIHMMDMLPEKLNRSIAFKEVPINSWPSPCGLPIKELPLRSMTGVSIIAVKRGGRVNKDPGPSFHIYPGDRLVIMGLPDKLEMAERPLNEIQEGGRKESDERLMMAEVKADENRGLTNRTLSEMRFRQEFGVTVLGIRRGRAAIEAPGPNYRIKEKDSLIMIGSPKAIKRFKRIELLDS